MIACSLWKFRPKVKSLPAFPFPFHMSLRPAFSACRKRQETTLPLGSITLRGLSGEQNLKLTSTHLRGGRDREQKPIKNALEV